MIELTDDLREFLKISINRGFLSFKEDNGDEYRIPLTEQRRELCLQAIVSGYWNVEKLLDT